MAQHSVEARGCSAGRARLDRRAKSQRLSGGGRLSLSRRSAGCSKRRGTRARCGLARAHSSGRITPEWSRRARRPVRSCRRGARLIRNVGRTDKTKNTDTKIKNKLHLAALNIGVVCSTSDSFHTKRHSRAAARCGVSLRSARSTRSTSRRRRHLLFRGCGVSRARQCLVPTSWLSRTAARAGQQPQHPGPIDAVGFFRPLRHHSVDGIGASGGWGSSRAACRNHAMGSRHSAASPSRCLAANSKMPCVFARSCRRGLTRTFGSSDRFVGNGRSVSEAPIRVSRPVASNRAAWRAVRYAMAPSDVRGWRGLIRIFG